jgi:uncharacterized Tic20 family protein
MEGIMAIETSPLSQDERLMALGAHAALAAFFMGPFCIAIPLLIWLFNQNKEKPSEFVIFQAKQAFFYQLAVYIGMLILSAITALLSLVIIGYILIPVVALAGIAAIVYAVYAAIQVWNGKSFRYMYVADFIEAGEK